MKIFVYHTPELTPEGKLPDCAIAIDVLRATTTIASALTQGVEAIQTFSNIDRLKQVSAEWPSEKRLRAGERGGSKIEGFDGGNSPLEYTADTAAGRRLFMSTTNGTRCLERIQEATTVLTAALVNRQAVVDYITANQPQTLWLVGSGWEGSFALEDTVCAGAICQGILDQTGLSLDTVSGNDEVIAAIALYQQWQHQLLALLNLSSHGQRLTRLNTLKDIEFCAQLDTLDIVPIQFQPGVLGQSSGGKT